jgi:hypothetical protein
MRMWCDVRVRRHFNYLNVPILLAYAVYDNLLLFLRRYDWLGMLGRVGRAFGSLTQIGYRGFSRRTKLLYLYRSCTYVKDTTFFLQ